MENSVKKRNVKRIQKEHTKPGYVRSTTHQRIGDKL
jgi:hypothetical protein